MLHICFGESEYCSIRSAMELELIEKEDVVCFNDDLSVGDISNCREYECREEVISNICYNDIAHRDDNDIVNIDNNEIKKELDDFYKMLLKENDFIIWYAHNPRDYCNLYYVVSLIKGKNIKVVECIKKTLGDTTLYYKWVGEVGTKDMPMLLNEARELSEEEKNIYSKKWELLVLKNGLLRAEVSGEIRTVDENYYDNLILNRVPVKRRLIACTVGELVGMDKPCLRDWFVILRIKHLEEIGCVEIDYRCNRYMLNNIIKKY